VSAGIFHHFHLEWIGDLSRVLNRGLLPPDYYALAERFAGGFGPDVLTLQRPDRGSVAEGPYLASVVIRHTSNHQIIATLEIVSPGNKNTRHVLRALVDKAVNVLRAGIHLVIVDLFPPGPRDPQGIHKAIWDEFIDNDFHLPSESSLTLASYIGGAFPEAFVELIAVGAPLPDMPLFLSPEFYVLLPLEKTYQSAWEAVPSFWRDVLTSDSPA
jgi:hypothetical protein